MGILSEFALAFVFDNGAKNAEERWRILHATVNDSVRLKDTLCRLLKECHVGKRSPELFELSSVGRTSKSIG